MTGLKVIFFAFCKLSWMVLYHFDEDYEFQ